MSCYKKCYNFWTEKGLWVHLANGFVDNGLQEN
jgi:hypothetical protein